MSKVSAFILSHSRTDRIYEGRRHNYRRIVTALDGIPGIKPLFAGLPNGVAPLVVPMVFSDPHRLFPKLKRLGVPVWRFGEYLCPQINEQVCEHSIYLSKHVRQFPCHQDLTDKEIHWMVDTILENVA